MCLASASRCSVMSLQNFCPWFFNDLYFFVCARDQPGRFCQGTKTPSSYEERWRSLKLLWGGGHTWPSDCKDLSSPHLVIPGLYNCQHACQWVVMLYKAFWVGKRGVKETEDKWCLQFLHREGAGLLRRIFLLLILVPMLLRGYTCSLAFMHTSWHPTNCAEPQWRENPFFFPWKPSTSSERAWVVVFGFGAVLFFGAYFFVSFCFFGGWRGRGWHEALRKAKKAQLEFEFLCLGPQTCSHLYQQKSMHKVWSAQPISQVFCSIPQQVRLGPRFLFKTFFFASQILPLHQPARKRAWICWEEKNKYSAYLLIG